MYVQQSAMDPKPSLLRNVLVRVLLFCVLAIGVRFAYIVALRGESCDLSDFCFFTSPLPDNNNLVTTTPSTSASALTVTTTSKPSPTRSNAVNFYSSVFQVLLVDGFLSPRSKSLCVDTFSGDDVVALKQIGVEDSIGISKKASKPLVVSGQAFRQPFKSNTFDFIFYGGGGIDRLAKQADFAAEACRTLKPQGFLVVHTKSKDTYSFYSFIGLFNCCIFVRTRDLDRNMQEFVLKKESLIVRPTAARVYDDDNDSDKDSNKCSVPGYKRELVGNAEPLITEEPLKPWITLKRNLKNIKYLATMVDIGFKRRYVYVDVGSRSYGSSIVSWFKKQYPKQNKTFEIYAVEADKAFHEEYRYKKGVTLLPYAAWVRNETLFFEVNQDPGREKEEKEKGRGMGRIKPVQSSGGKVGSDVNRIQGFDFADWLKSTVLERDFVVMKMDVEGTEFDLIPRLFETGAICLIDEIFLECHYNRWQKCCPGERSSKYEKKYAHCLKLFTDLRNSGVLVHQWW